MALVSIVLRNSSIRFGWTSTSTITAMGLAIPSVVEYVRLLAKADNAVGGFRLKACEVRKSKRQAPERSFILCVCIDGSESFSVGEFCQEGEETRVCANVASWRQMLKFKIRRIRD